jgi:hypothetical protein
MSSKSANSETLQRLDQAIDRAAAHLFNDQLEFSSSFVQAGLWQRWHMWPFVARRSGTASPKINLLKQLPTGASLLWQEDTKDIGNNDGIEKCCRAKTA